MDHQLFVLHATLSFKGVRGKIKINELRTKGQKVNNDNKNTRKTINTQGI